MQWKHPSSPVAKKFKTLPSAGKLMLTIFLDSQGPILETYQERGTTVTSATYCDILQRELKPTIRSTRRGKLSKEILLLHNNAHPHTAAHTLETLKQLKWEAMEHPAYSPDLAPSDFHLFNRSKMLYGEDDSHVMMMRKQRCISGYALNQKHFLLMALKSW